jgi:hypothetical protein
MAEESRLSLCTMAIAISAQAATTGRPLGPMDLRSTDEDTLPTSFESVLK